MPLNHHSSGGFVFYRDAISSRLFVVLIQNKRGEFVIPKGHVEDGESSIDAALREINEESGVKPEYLKYSSFVVTDKYEFKLNGEDHIKTVDLYAFEAKIKVNLTPLTSEGISTAAWYQFEEAVDMISFNQKELLSARQLFYYNRENKKHLSISEVNSLTIAIPIFNGEKTIGETLESVKNEIKRLPKHIDAEIIVCLDHCTDKSLDVIRSFEYQNLKILTNPLAQGKTNTLNFIFENSKGDLFCIIDDDVLLDQQSLTNLTQELINNAKIRIAFASWKQIRYSGKSIVRKFWNTILGVKFEIQPYDKPSEILRGACMIMRREDYVFLPTEHLTNEDQFLQYIYWPHTAEVKNAVIYFRSVSSLYGYYKRFERISVGDILAKKYFTLERTQFCDSALFRRVDWRRIRTLPYFQKMSFYLYRIIRRLVKLYSSYNIKKNKVHEWFRI